MTDLTLKEVERIVFLYKCGVHSEEIVASINEDREVDEEKKANDVDSYIWCIFDRTVSI